MSDALLALAVAALGTLGWFGALLFFVVCAAGAVTALWLHQRRTEALVATEGDGWKALADALGFEVRDIHQLRGTWQGRPARVERIPRGLTAYIGEAPTALRVRPYSPGTPVTPSTGDPVFDARFHVEWPPEHPEAVASEVRAWLATVPAELQVRAFKGRLHLDLPEGSDARVEEALDWLAQLADTLEAAAARPVTARLQPGEPHRVRAALAAQLDPARDVEALDRLLADPDPTVRTTAAIARGHVDTLAGLLALQGLPAADRYRARRAVPDAAVPTVVARLAASDVPEAWLDAAHLAAHRPSPEASTALLGLLRPDAIDLSTWRADDERGRRLALRLARALEAAPCPGTTEALIALLATDPARQVDALCLRHLEAHATVDHVQALRGLDDALARDQRAHVERIVARIQADAGGSAGQLALVDPAPHAGAVSLTEGPHG